MQKLKDLISAVFKVLCLASFMDLICISKRPNLLETGYLIGGWYREADKVHPEAPEKGDCGFCFSGN